MSVSPMHTNGMLQVGKSEDIKAGDITQTVFEDCVVQIDGSGAGFIHDHYMIDFNRRKRVFELVLEGYNDDDIIVAPLVIYRIADPTMLLVWLVRQPEYRTVICKLSIHITHLWATEERLHGFQANGQPVHALLRFWLRARNMSRKPMLPRLKEIDVLIHCTTMYFAGTWTRGKLHTAPCHAMMAECKKKPAM
ncbi:hypothetical protein COCMIDRAFT_31763 [Bipolaris oryzae ATCC 44560]|uniref:Uncharacterized protein n=1 Tax=Bipolaris oryzae ATCC 44560 TaxID=930090 RepID=W6ZLA4_COCMI|nr:uncharacterized protein COCMIDRAFT_31763 [Bipolaris oryzae ATCC 44560]EUC50860.1 hypothetical protein COCMIDRAFT_31763 [Bipolaris oryzae ATCC 44560]